MESVLKIPYIVQLKFLDCITFAKAEDLTAQFTLDCSVVMSSRSKQTWHSLACAVKTERLWDP
jgi:ACR3 family arsenite efflux pump ArsB